jgi:hypothetical protein
LTGRAATEVPSWYEEPVYAPDALTATAVQLALLTALGIGPDPRSEQTVTVQDPIPYPFGIAFDGVEVDTAAPLSVAGGYAAVIELLATTATLGGVPVSDEDSESTALEVLASAGIGGTRRRSCWTATPRSETRLDAPSPAARLRGGQTPTTGAPGS